MKRAEINEFVFHRNAPSEVRFDIFSKKRKKMFRGIHGKGGGFMLQWESGGTKSVRRIHVEEIREAIAQMAIHSNTFLPQDVEQVIKNRKAEETDSRAKDILEKIESNVRLSEEENIPLCQDTGLACVFLKIGQEVCFEGGNLYEAIHQGVRDGYEKGFLRKSVVEDPLRRKNTGDNTPAHIHVDMVEGNQVELTFAPKGFGSENMSQIKMLSPADGEQGVIDFVLQVVKDAGGNPCPPIVVGVGIGGTFDLAALLAKKALLIPLDQKPEDSYYADLENLLLKKINELNIGPQGFGGDTTALAVKILAAPTHIAGLPVAVNINCHVSRHEKVII